MRKLLLFAFLMFGTTLMAQKKDKGKPREVPHRYTVQEAVNLQSKRLTMTLNLNEEQQSKVKKLLNEQMLGSDKNKTKEKQNSKRNKVASQYKGNHSSEGHQKEMRSILSAAQYRQWEKLLAGADPNEKNNETTRIIVKN